MVEQGAHRAAHSTRLLAIVSLELATTAAAQEGMRWKGSSGWGAGGHYGRMYDAKTVETVSGEVVTVDRITPMI